MKRHGPDLPWGFGPSREAPRRYADNSCWKPNKTDTLLSFIDFHIHSADDHYVRWKWAVGSVAMWDNRATVHRVIPGTYEGERKGIRTTVFGEKRKFYYYWTLHRGRAIPA